MIHVNLGLDEIKLHCRIDHDFDDEILQTYAEAALEVCQQHIGKRFSDGLELTSAIKVGCLMYIGLLYENRELVSSLTMKEVPFTISSLWSVYRDVGVY